MPPGKDWIMASADTGVVPGGPYKGGDEKIAVGPYKPDDQAGRMWENFLQKTGGKTPFNYEINLNDKGLENIGADATITGDKGGQWSAQGSYDFPTNQEVMGPFEMEKSQGSLFFITTMDKSKKKDIIRIIFNKDNGDTTMKMDNSKE